jgi:hypothetical protein
MLVTTNAPIIEEQSNASGKKKKGTFGKNVTEKFKSGYGKFKEAGGLPVVENLLKLNTGTPVDNTGLNTPPPPPPPPPTGMSTTTKVVIGVLVVGAIAGAYYYFSKGKGKGKKSSK